MSIPADPVILGYQRRSALARGRDEDLVGRIAVKRLRQFAALDENGARQLPHAQPRGA